MIKILIVDDEAPARERLTRMLRSIFPGAIIHIATNGLEALDKIKIDKPDILFLDIQMPGMTGFDVLQNLESKNFQIIFQTAYEQFAVKAFEESACDYLLKPYSLERLEKSCRRALQGIENSSGLRKLDDHLHQKDHFLQKIAIKQGDKIILVEVSDIVFLKSSDHYTCIYTDDKEWTCDLSLSYLEKQLDPSHFIRCHRSQIVSLPFIQKLHLGPRMRVELTNGMTLDVARSYRTKLREILFGTIK